MPLAYSKSALSSGYVLKVGLYTLFLLFVQSAWVSRFPPPAFRIDLLLPLMFGTAIEWPPVLTLAWASGWGFVLDTLSGKFWGFHVGSYVVAVCLVNIVTERFELHSLLYQMLFVGACALGQSAALGLFLFLEAPAQFDVPASYLSLLIRSFLTVLVTPLIIYPINYVRGSKL